MSIKEEISFGIVAVIIVAAMITFAWRDEDRREALANGTEIEVTVENVEHIDGLIKDEYYAYFRDKDGVTARYSVKKSAFLDLKGMKGEKTSILVYKKNGDWNGNPLTNQKVLTTAKNG